MEADLIIINAVIYSANPSFEIYQAMAVKEGKVLDLASDDEILSKYNSDQIINADGKSVYPGFIDPHCHFYGYGSSLQTADLRNTSSFNEILEIIKKHAGENQDGWILGRGWDQNDWDNKSWPDNKELNRLFPDRPVFLVRIDGHAALVNDKALQLAEIKRNTSVKGGAILLEEGRLTGLLVDNAVDLVNAVVPKEDTGQINASLLGAQRKCLAVGLTSVHDCGLNLNVIEMIDKLQKDNKLQIGIYAMLNPTRDNFEKYMFNGIYRTDKLHIRSVKLYADGALGSRGALMIEPYADDPGNRGLSVSTSDYLTEISKLAYSYGYQVNTHCIGDGANREVLHIYADILKGKNDRRWRIEHAQVIHPDDFILFGKYSVIPSVQSTHASSDMYWAEDRIGERIKYAYAYNSLLNQNGWLPNGSDFPIEDINPIFGFYASVARKDQKGWPEDGFQAEEALSRENALKSMTIWAAKAGFEENERGSLEPGKRADFVITDEDIMKVAEKQIFQTKVLKTFISGNQVFSKNN